MTGHNANPSTRDIPRRNLLYSNCLSDKSRHIARESSYSVPTGEGAERMARPSRQCVNLHPCHLGLVSVRSHSPSHSARKRRSALVMLTHTRVCGFSTPSPTRLSKDLEQLAP